MVYDNFSTWYIVIDWESKTMLSPFHTNFSAHHGLLVGPLNPIWAHIELSQGPCFWVGGFDQPTQSNSTTRKLGVMKTGNRRWPENKDINGSALHFQLPPFSAQKPQTETTTIRHSFHFTLSSLNLPSHPQASQTPPSLPTLFTLMPLTALLSLALAQKRSSLKRCFSAKTSD